jgi:hypothetical protein
MTKRLEAEDNPKKVLKPEKDQGYASVLPAAGAKKQPFMLTRKEVLRQVSGLDVW